MFSETLKAFLLLVLVCSVAAAPGTNDIQKGGSKKCEDGFRVCGKVCCPVLKLCCLWSGCCNVQHILGLSFLREVPAEESWAYPSPRN